MQPRSNLPLISMQPRSNLPNLCNQEAICHWYQHITFSQSVYSWENTGGKSLLNRLSLFLTNYRSETSWKSPLYILYNRLFQDVDILKKSVVHILRHCAGSLYPPVNWNLHSDSSEIKLFPTCSYHLYDVLPHSMPCVNTWDCSPMLFYTGSYLLPFELQIYWLKK